MADMSTKEKTKKLSEEEVDQVVVAQAENDSAWGKPVHVRKAKPAAVQLSAELAARAAFFARLHREASAEAWLRRIIRERLDLETPLLPTHELLGDLLLELNMPAQALQEFEAALQMSPHRFNGLSGAARAAQLAGDEEKAHTYYAQLVSLCAHADSARSELTEARTFLAKRQ
jgi:tetratricopeptide (TPR) repeat protein